MFSKFLKDNMNVTSMIFLGLGIDENIINKDDHKDTSSSMKMLFIRYMK